MVHKITTILPASPVSFNTKLRHLSCLHLAGPEFGIPRNSDVLLGVDMLSRVVCQGCQHGPPVSRLAFCIIFPLLNTTLY